jgi:DEAD/DEAH box helicase domain-containing protein
MAVLPYASDDRRDGVVGLSFALKQVAQLLLMCDAHDIGISINSEEVGGSAATSPQTIYVYDNYPGGIGFSAALYELHGELLDATRRLIAECPCENGCPGCVGPIGYTGPLAKVAALRILDLIGAPSPEGPGLGRVLSDPPSAGDEEVVPF